MKECKDGESCTIRNFIIIIRAGKYRDLGWKGRKKDHTGVRVML
jgi:hypothetical protein